MEKELNEEKARIEAERKKIRETEEEREKILEKTRNFMKEEENREYNKLMNKTVLA